MVVVAQLVRASVCGTEGRRFEPGLPPRNTSLQSNLRAFFVRDYEMLFLIANQPILSMF